ncbi:inverse autotransporter beta domain-containing protein [Roseimicrobium sp. ORNL1]|uniref:inverse autotransporter beta domain-containing protein n=1 Tax=Roseimicrobium sp. ORNL1 TaxID=2711231 RepID=UPI0013E0FC97|nr:inverse autotransporter beta domain-containing protein [Roseimicrobium sp. ORNL1]QIF02136.1 hypothetical protein G5S37_11525 [Roseimicrobium sp. ORNL1]
MRGQFSLCGLFPFLRRPASALLPLLGLMLGSGSTLLAGPEPVVKADEKSAKAVTIHDQWSLPGIFGGGVKTTDEYTEGNVFLVLPVISTVGQDGLLSGDVLFIEPYSSWGEQGEVAASLGFGWRHYFTTQSVSAVTKHDGHQAGIFEEGVYVGANFFVDMLDTEIDNQFWQLGVGAEIGTRYFEIRGNYYIPLTERKLVLEQRSKQTFTNSSTSLSQQVSGEPFATGNTVQQELTTTTLATTTTSTTTIEQLFRLYEEGMEGWDVQASLLVPGLDRWMDVFFIGGYYSFDNQPFGPQTGGTGNVEGWKAGVEVRPVPAVVLNATWYEDERYVGSDWLYGLRLEIPFEMGDLGDGKGFWDRVGESFTPRRRHLAERLVEPVRRQNEAIKVGNDTEQKVDVDTSVQRVTKVVAQSSQRVVLQEDIVFVNNGAAVGNGIGAGSASGTGTAEQPFDTIVAGGTLAGTKSVQTNRVWNVYTQGGVDYSADVFLPSNFSQQVKFIGSGTPIPGLGGRTFGTGPRPKVTAPNGISAQWGKYIGIYGYDFNSSPLYIRGVEQSEIVGNHFYGTAPVKVEAGGSLSGEKTLVKDNLIANELGVQLFTIIGSIEADIVNNVFERTIWGVNLSAWYGGTIKANITGNTINYTVSGINVDARGFPGSFGTVEATVTGNTIRSVTDENYARVLRYNADGKMDLTFEGNILTERWGHLIEGTSSGGQDNSLKFLGNQITNGTFVMYNHPTDGTTMDFTAIGNVFTNSNLQLTDLTGVTVTDNVFHNPERPTTAIQIESNGAHALDAVIQRNQIYNPKGTGVALAATTNASVVVTISDNAFTGATDSGGVLINSNGSAEVTAHVENNTMTGLQYGVSMRSWNDALGITAYVRGNEISHTTGEAVRLATDSQGYIWAEVANNYLLHSGGDGVQLFAADYSHLIAHVSANAITDAQRRGIYVEARYLADVLVNPAANVITNSRGAGIEWQSLGEAVGGIIHSNLFEANTITGAGNGGIVLVSGNEGALTVKAFNLNTITNTVAGSHLSIERGGAGEMTIQGTLNNTATPTPNPTAGDTLKVDGTPTLNFLLNSSVITVPVTVP